MGPTWFPSVSHMGPTWFPWDPAAISHMGLTWFTHGSHKDPQVSHMGPIWFPQASHVGPMWAFSATIYLENHNFNTDEIVMCQTIS